MKKKTNYSTIVCIVIFLFSYVLDMNSTIFGLKLGFAEANPITIILLKHSLSAMIIIPLTIKLGMGVIVHIIAGKLAVRSYMLILSSIHLSAGIMNIFLIGGLL